MQEKLLHFIWQFQYFNKKELLTTQEEVLQILKPGHYNTHQGPDFLNGSINVDNITLVGNIELHLNSSDWFKHQHTKDKNYANIILHVVWNNDKPVTIAGKQVPTLELKTRVAKTMLQRYEWLMNEQNIIACSKFLPVLSEIGWMAWKERLTIERLEQKSKYVLELFEQSNHHWEEVFWWMIARNFGSTVNTECFEAIAKSISINILAKHKNQIHQIEALLLGQANLLNESFEEAYPQMLQKEYAFLQKKYQLKHCSATPLFLRMRPANFPTVRLAQLAMLVHHSSHLFSKIKEIDLVTDVKQLFNVTANDYWHYHYQLDVSLQDKKPKVLGNQMVQNIIINTIIPVLFAYGIYHNEQLYKDKAIQWLQQLPAEKNTITDSWKQLAISNQNAFDSQSLLQLTKLYCNKHECLKCAVGNKLLRQE
ncbi:MAG: DUF2851 family protein [Chitinophagaceae bacterium]|jgi:hypothetical protein|nr:DUF2851 family protein [Chitinophagaceae bacterium]